jgi:hypothetical protein
MKVKIRIIDNLTTQTTVTTCKISFQIQVQPMLFFSLYCFPMYLQANHSFKAYDWQKAESFLFS